MCGLDLPVDPNLIAGAEGADDAGVYRLNDETALIQTVDFFTPIVDDPFRFGQITAANALSDVYAMGGVPLLAMNLVFFPLAKLDKAVLKDILAGGLDKIKEAGALLVGGHSIEDDELKYGLSVTGTVHPEQVKLNSGFKPGDQLLLTKPLGTGILSTAIKGGLAGEEVEKMITGWMTALNKKASKAMAEAGAHGCTDITGFGLIGHLMEVANASKVSIQLNSRSVPVLPDTGEFASLGIIPEGAHRNKKFYEPCVKSSLEKYDPLEIILYDPQTSGGLIIGAPPENIEVIRRKLENENLLSTAVIGTVEEGPAGVVIN